MKHLLLLLTAAALTACSGTPRAICSEPIYGCNNGQTQRAAPATSAPAGPTKPSAPSKPSKGDKPGHGHGDKGHNHSGPRGHGKGGKKGGVK